MAIWIRDLSLKYKFWALNMVTFVIAVAAVEAAVGLALVIAYYRRKRTVSLDQLTPTLD